MIGKRAIPSAILITLATLAAGPEQANAQVHTYDPVTIQVNETNGKYPNVLIEIRQSVENFIISSGIDIARNPGIKTEDKLLALTNNLCIAESTGIQTIDNSKQINQSQKVPAREDFIRFIDDLRIQVDYLKEQDNAEYVYWLLYQWEKGDYVQAEFRELTERERKQINKQLLDEIEVEEDE